VSSINLFNPVVVGWAVDGLLVGREEMGSLACSGRRMVLDGLAGDFGLDDESPDTDIKFIIY
jgi:hypothetical protein